jgi:hypothetical protein
MLVKEGKEANRTEPKSGHFEYEQNHCMLIALIVRQVRSHDCEFHIKKVLANRSELAQTAATRSSLPSFGLLLSLFFS